jgi:hypothetical protein
MRRKLLITNDPMDAQVAAKHTGHARRRRQAGDECALAATKRHPARAAATP